MSMKKVHLTSLVACMCIMMLQGCATKGAANQGLTSANGADVKRGAATSGNAPSLQACLFEVDLLVKKNKKFQPKADEIYSTVKSIKYYSSVSANVSGNVRAAVTPFYEYKLHKTCNEVSVLLMQELMAGPSALIGGDA
ncbi:MAG: hypothetical protein ACRCXB_03560 [Aeromonadaceae bacterium]